MQKWLDHIDILMYVTHNEGNYVVVERFIKTLKGKIFKKTHLMIANAYHLIIANTNANHLMIANACLSYLDKLVNQFNNTYHRSIGKKSIDVDWSSLTEEIGLSYKAPGFKVSGRGRIAK